MWTAVKMWMIFGRGFDSMVSPVGIVAGAVALLGLVGRGDGPGAGIIRPA
jgi:hypothetical protein